MMTLKIEIPDDTSWVSAIGNGDYARLVEIKIDNNEYTVPNVIAVFIDRFYNAMEQQRKQYEIQANAYERSLLLIGEKWYKQGLFQTEDQQKMLAIISDYLDKERMHQLEKQWELEVKYGMTGWIQENWGKLCKIECECGSLVSYDVLRSTSRLICKNCYEKANRL